MFAPKVLELRQLLLKRLEVLSVFSLNVAHCATLQIAPYRP